MRLFETSALGLVAFAFGCRLSDPASCPLSPIVQTKAGPVQGFDRDLEGRSVSSYWKIPFAKPPVGALRFHYPVPDNRTWSDVRRSLVAARMCSQKGSVNGSEDCLYLNVYSPRKASSSNGSQLLPVMFWIYGGAYVAGDSNHFDDADSMLYDGGRLAGLHDVVVVTTNYRLNVLGFNTYTTGSNGQTGTQAMEDQRLAMQWAHENIHAFGGDPEKVTLFGESAGAFSVMYHLVSPPSWPFFSKAIMQSGVSRLSWFFQPKDLAVDLFDSWAEAVGCGVKEGQLSCLQALPAAKFVEAPSGLSGRSPSFPNMPVGPVIDGTDHGLQAMPSALVETGKHHKIPLVLGSNADGGTVFEPLVANIVPGTDPEAYTEHDVELILNWTFTAEDQAKIRKMYRADDYGSRNLGKNVKMVSRIVRDFGFMCSDRLLARKWREHGLDAYLYTFNFDLGVLDKVFQLGDFHGADLPFTWRANHLIDKLKNVLAGMGDAKWMAQIMSCQWATFAYTGSPSGSNSSTVAPNCQQIHDRVKPWPVFAEDESYYSLQADGLAIINQTYGGGPKVKQLHSNNTYPDDERPSNMQCDMWDTVHFPWHKKKKATAIADVVII